MQVSIKILNVGAWARTSERVPVTLPRELEDFIPEVSFYLLLLLSNFDLSVLVGGGVLQDEAQWEEVTVAPPHVQWHSYLCQQVRGLTFFEMHVISLRK